MSFRGINCLIYTGRLKKLFLNRNHVAVFQTQTANLRSAVENPIKRLTPWPYETQSYTVKTQMMDNTSKRMNENSKIIAVEGNIGTNKSEFAKKLAEEFDMKYVAEPTEEEIFFDEGYHCDLRVANEILPEGAKFVDLESFYTSKNPEKLGIARTQISYLLKRLQKYHQGSSHFMNTGQGLVVDRTPYGSNVYAEALYKSGYTSKQAFRYYNEVEEYVMEPYWRPHVYIYLGAPSSYIQEQIKKRGISYEVGSKVLTEDYIKTIDSLYRQKFLPGVAPYSEVLVYDAHDMPPWEVIVADIEKLDLNPPIRDEPTKLEDWENEFEHRWNMYRTFLSSGKPNYQNYTTILVPPKCWEYDEYGTHFNAWRVFFKHLEQMVPSEKISLL